MAAIDEEKKHAVRKLEGEKQELKIENENLKKKLSGKIFIRLVFLLFHSIDRDEQTTARRRVSKPLISVPPWFVVDE